MKKYILTVFIGLIISAPASATEWGVGFSTKSTDQTIYFPIKAGNKLRIEPFYRERKTTENSRGLYSNYKTTQDFFEIGAGLFSITNIKEKSQLFYGVRFSYLESESTYKSDGSNLKTKSNGYTISPTIGFEYMLTDTLSIGGEAEWHYRDVSQSRIDSTGNINQNVKMTETEKRFIIRYLF